MKPLERIIVVDLEASCWLGNPPPGQMREIIQIGAVLVDLEKLDIIREIDLKVKPVRSKISAFCTQLTGLTQDIVDRGVIFPVACATLIEDLRSKSCAWASWGEYDQRMMREMCQYFKADYPFGVKHFNLKEFFSLFTCTDKGNGQRIAAEALGLSFEGRPHDGLNDARMAARCMLTLQRYVREGMERVHG